MRIAIVYQYFQGHAEPGHSLIYELSQYLAHQGHHVTVIAGATGYMRRGLDSPKGFFNRIFRREREGGVEVWRTYAYSELHRSYTGRLLSFLSFTVSAAVGLLFLPRPDVVLGSSPPLFPVFSTWAICRLRGIPYVTEVRDLWPASAVQLGLLSNRRLIALMAWMERKLYDGSKRVVALTQGIFDDIAGRGWPADRLALVTCGIDSTMLYPDAKAAAEVRSRLDLQSQHIVLYFGALGEANNLPVILRAAQRLRERTDIAFLLVGDGMKRADLEAEVTSTNLRNVRVLPAVPKDQARAYICAADLCLVTLQDIPLFHGAIPTKLLDYMACGRPVLCGVRGEALRIAEDARAGVGFSPDDDAELAATIEALLTNVPAREEMARAGPSYVAVHYSAEATRQKMEHLLVAAATTRDSS